jgi:chaperonin cofactor prefoldin
MYGQETPVACGRCPKDELKRVKQDLADIKKAIEALETLGNTYLNATRDRDMYAISGELLYRKSETKRRIKSLKAEIKDIKSKKKKHV